jgi:hypothetical protein
MLALLLTLAAGPPAVVPLTNAHAHNDYAHRRPLAEALANGFTSVEADVFLIDGVLYVGHTRFELRKSRTLESLYLAPLKKRVAANAGRVYPGRGKGPAAPFFLMVDVKSDGKPTYAALDRLLEKYAALLTVCRDGKVTRGAVTVVVSGACPREVIVAQKVRRAAIDGRPADLDSAAPAHLIPFVSTRWGSEFRWDGRGAMPAAERAKLRAMAAKARKGGRLLRFWAAPDREEAWRELRDAGVGLINTDRLGELRAFLVGPRE